jgi:hypothetical protein
MNNVLAGAGILCIISAIIGGGVRMFGGEIPVLQSVKRQTILGSVGLILLLLSFAPFVVSGLHNAPQNGHDNAGNQQQPSSDNQQPASTSNQQSPDTDNQQPVKKPHSDGPASSDAQTAQVRQQEAEKQETSIDLSGLWTAEGYTCPGAVPVPPEQVSIVQSENTVTATKTVGDDCIPAGVVTFKGTYTEPNVPSSMGVKATVLNSPSGVYGLLDATLTIRNNDSIIVRTPYWTLVLHRIH